MEILLVPVAALFVLVPLFVMVGFAFIFGLIAYRAASGVAEWSRNNDLPIAESAARVVAKRSDTWGGGGSHHGAHRRVRTGYYATFELRSGERKEFEMSGPQFGVLLEGDQGTLRHQGTRYHDFIRSNVKASADADF